MSVICVKQSKILYHAPVHEPHLTYDRDTSSPIFEIQWKIDWAMKYRAHQRAALSGMCSSHEQIF